MRSSASVALATLTALSVAGFACRTSAPPERATDPAKVPDSSRVVAGEFSADGAYADLASLVTLERYYGAKGRPQAIEHLRTELAKVAGDVSLERFEATEPVSGARYELVNLLARQSPEKRRRMLFASHWDSRLWAERDANPALRNRPGQYANDGGSGVAVLLELARHTRALTNIGVDLVLFDGEEFGREQSDDYCQGSRYFAKHARQGFYRVALPEAAVVLDMVGDRELDLFPEESSLARAPVLTEEIFRIGKTLGHGEFHRDSRYLILDDHTALQDIGIPSLLLIDYDYSYWHTHKDTLDKVSAASLGVVGRVLLQFLIERDRK